MIVRAFGLFWNVTGVDWDAKRMVGVYEDSETKEKITSNCWAQSGIYCLYHEFMPIYVGRAVSRNLGDRVNSHRSDRLAGRWDSFSWFGTHKVNKDGTLQAFKTRLTKRGQIVRSLEAFALIAFDPRLNRRHESIPSALEFIQQVDRPKALRTLVEEIHKSVNKIDVRTKKLSQTSKKKFAQ